MGGGLGVLIGWSIGRIINFGTNVFIERQGLPAQQIWFVPWWLVFGARRTQLNWSHWKRCGMSNSFGVLLHRNALKEA